MLGKCTNPSCYASFRYLEDGMLFRLETDRTQRLPNPRMPEYYWLCCSCSTTMTLRISKEGNIVIIALPLPVQRGSRSPDFIPSSRQKGLVLSGVSFSTKDIAEVRDTSADREHTMPDDRDDQDNVVVRGDSAAGLGVLPGPNLVKSSPARSDGVALWTRFEARDVIASVLDAIKQDVISNVLDAIEAQDPMPESP